LQVEGSVCGRLVEIRHTSDGRWLKCCDVVLSLVIPSPVSDSYFTRAAVLNGI